MCGNGVCLKFYCVQGFTEALSFLHVYGGGWVGMGN